MNLLRSFRSIRTVLTLWYAIVLLAAMLALVGVTYFYLSRELEAALQEEIVDEIQWVDGLVLMNWPPSQAGPDSTLMLKEDLRQIIVDQFSQRPKNFVVLLETTGGAVLYRSPGPTIPSSVPSSQGEMILESVPTAAETSYRAARIRRDSVVMTVALPELHVDHVLGHYLAVTAWIVPAAVLAAVAGGWILAGLTLRPVRKVADHAARITIHNLTERIPPRGTGDELDQLITTMNFMLSRLESSFAQMRDFLLNVAHELKTPLTILRGEAELAVTGKMKRDEVQQLLTSHLEETVRMSRLIDDLLILTRADAGQMVVSSVPVDIRELMAEVADDAAVMSSGRNITVVTQENQPGTVYGDEGRLRQLFRILVSNAVMYTDDGGTVTIDSRNDGRRMTIVVADTGIGISSEDLPRVFNRFFRGEGAKSRRPGGTGLGLSLAKWIAETHDGTIEVRSVPGTGTSFTVSLPTLS